MSNCSFTLRSTRLRDSSGNIVMDEQFYLNNDTYTEALKDILHCFAFGNSIWRKNMTIRKECGSYISFNFFLNGDAEIQYESRKLTAHAGDLLVAQFRNGFTVKTGPSGMARKQCLLLSYTPVQAAICRQLFPEDLTLVHLPHPGRIRKILDEIAGNVSGDTCEMDLLCRNSGISCIPGTNRNRLYRQSAFLRNRETHGSGGRNWRNIAESASVH